MASASHCSFSNNGQFLANCGTDGKLKIWETSTNRLKQEFVPNLHLQSPCSSLGWIVVGTQHSSTSPWKKRRKKSMSEDAECKEIIAMGSTNGTITLYDISTSTISDQLLNGHSSSVTAVTWSPVAGLFTAAEDKHIVEWDLQEKAVKCKWKSGKGKVTSLAVLPEGKSLLSGERTIKWWDLETKQVIGTFTGHANQVNALCCAKINSETNYLISSANGDDFLSVWSLNEAQKDMVPVATLTLPDEALSFSVRTMKDSQIWILSVTRSGHAQLFKYQANGVSPKPIKPTLNVMVAAEAGQKESVQQIPIIVAELAEDGKMILAFGSFLGLTIEKVVPDFSDKVQCLVRNDQRKMKEKKEVNATKVKNPISDDAEYITAGAEESTAMKRSKSGKAAQLPFKLRLENLSLDTDASTSDGAATKGQSMSQLLAQALQSEDKTMLANALYIKKENVIKNTVAKLPVQLIIPLIKQLTKMLEGGKTYPSQIAVMWLKALVMTHAAQMISDPRIDDALAPIMSYIEGKAALLPDLIKLKGRVDLVVDQFSQRAEKSGKDITEECLLVYEDQDSSDEDIYTGKVESASESDNWDETSDRSFNNEEVENQKSNDDLSICSSD
ncbi:hypothetical protein QAD02_016208 [Eretmocerus hayati]|uniref:Uncharacterized protein n=1 Tax=Eretmocerus hayati TaxID=131215 RepID=A0ACC2PAF3_9HYME|nr:hypothetical protein QAD02_016208 [Eretmocerus hayati]